MLGAVIAQFAFGGGIAIPSDLDANVVYDARAGPQRGPADHESQTNQAPQTVSERHNSMMDEPLESCKSARGGSDWMPAAYLSKDEKL